MKLVTGNWELSWLSPVSEAHGPGSIAESRHAPPAHNDSPNSHYTMVGSSPGQVKSRRALPPSSNRVTVGPLSAYSSRPTASANLQSTICNLKCRWPLAVGRRLLAIGSAVSIITYCVPRIPERPRSLDSQSEPSCPGGPGRFGRQPTRLPRYVPPEQLNRRP